MVRPIRDWEIDEIKPLIEMSQADGYDFLQRLWDEYQSGKNRFDEPGAVLLGLWLDGGLIAIGGVHPDPYLNDARIGRVRHLYVRSSHQRSGWGRMLMQRLIDHASEHFDTLTLRTPTAHADAFYRAIGFKTEPRFAEASHWMDLRG